MIGEEILPGCVTSSVTVANNQQMESALLERSVPTRPLTDADYWMERYQQADPDAPGALINALSPALLRFFRSESGSREQADDLLQETWMRIHRVRHTYRPGEPVLPWVYAIARRVRIDGYRKTRRVTAHETAMEVLPEAPQIVERRGWPFDFETLIAALPEAQREVLIMLKVGGLTLEEAARATSSTVGAVKQKAHRAYEKIRTMLECRAKDASGGEQ
jgi:RNA polymerase sigma-70 factor (ECF subfamily)